MIVDVTLYYSVLVRFPKKRNWTAVPVIEHHPVAFREFSPAEAPRVATFNHPHISSYDSNFQSELLKADGEFWLTVGERPHKEPARKVTIPSFEAAVGHMQFHSSDDRPGYGRPDPVDLVAFNGLGFKEIGRSSRDAAIEAAEAYANQHIIVSDQVFERSAEPVLTTLTFGFSESGSVRIESFSETHMTSRGCFRLDRLGDAVDHVNGRGLKVPVTMAEQIRSHGIVVERPDLLEFDNRDSVLRNEIQEYVDEFDKDFLKTATREQLIAFVEARDALKTPGLDAAEVIAAARGLISLEDQEPTGRFKGKWALEAIVEYENQASDDDAIKLSA